MGNKYVVCVWCKVSGFTLWWYGESYPRKFAYVWNISGSDTFIALPECYMKLSRQL